MDGDRIVPTGTVGIYDYDGIIALQGQPDPNGGDAHSGYQTMTYPVIVPDTPQTLRIRPGGWSGEEDDYSIHEALMIDCATLTA